jgi:hypothetical protein
MRTTLTIEDDVAKLLESVRKARNTSLKAVVNQALRQGLKEMIRPVPRRKLYETRSVSLGRCHLANLDDISEVLAVAEGDTFK